MQTPCYKCPERTADCHGRCKRYKEWSAWRDGRRKAEREAAAPLNGIYERMTKIIRKKVHSEKR